MSQSIEVKVARANTARILASRISKSVNEELDGAMIEESIAEQQRLFGEALMHALGFHRSEMRGMAVWRNGRGDTADARLIERVLEW